MPKRTVYLAAGAVLVLLSALYALFYAGVWQRPDFQTYKPAVLPAGAAVTSTELYVLRSEGLIPSFRKHINANLDAPNSWISQWKSDGSIANPCSDFPANNDCASLTTGKGQKYQLSAITNQDSGERAYDVRFIREGTEIWVTLRTKKEITVAEWDRTVNSFEPATFKDTRVRRGSASGP